MTRSKDAWLTGPGDLAEAVVEDVPVPGQSVLVRGLSAKYAAEVQSQLKMTQEGREQIAKIDVASMERLQFQHGCVEPSFTAVEAAAIQERFGAAFRKVVSKIDELSGIDKAAIEQVEQRFPDGGAAPGGPDVGDGAPAGSAGPDVLMRTGA